MKRLRFIIALTFSSIILYGQNDTINYSSVERKHKGDTIVLSSDIEIIQYSLARYHKERQIGLCFGVASLGFAGIVATNQLIDAYNRQFDEAIHAPVSYNDSPAVWVFGLAGIVTGITSLAILIDADKWLKRANLKLTPGGAVLYF